MASYHNGLVNLSQESCVLDQTDNKDLDKCVKHIRSSRYFKMTQSEALCRTIIDVILCDRLELLVDNNSERRLNMVHEVTLQAYSQRLKKLVTGRADWSLAHDDPKSSLDSTLILLCVSYHLDSISLN
jgi:hypothetical protein